MESSTIINEDNHADKASMAVPQEEATTAQKSSHPNATRWQRNTIGAWTRIHLLIKSKIIHIVLTVGGAPWAA